MEEQVQEQSVNTVEVAEPQQEQVQSVESSEVADPKPVQDEQTNAHYAEQRRKQELEQYRSKATDYENHLNKLASLSGYQSTDELFKAIEEAERQQERQQYEQAGIDPDTFNSLLEKHPDIQWAREQKQRAVDEQKFQQEADEFFKTFPDAKADDIPPEVWQLREEGLPLVHAYRSHMFDNVKTQSEQEALKKLQQNQSSSTGSLSQGEVEHNTSIKDMSKAEFEAFTRKVKNGEVRNF